MKGSTTGNSSFICHLDSFLRAALNRGKDKDIYFGVKTGECEIKNSSLFNLLEVKMLLPMLIWGTKNAACTAHL